MTVYYNEWDGPTADWLEELIRCRLVADGVVDRRSILNVSASDLKDFTQCHFFAGIGGWSYALRLAGWPDDRPVFTGSPPCQPFSSAGQQKGQDDDRHLAPHFAALVAECRPPIIFGEQVASSAVFGKATSGTRKSPATDTPPEWAWLDDLSERLEAAHYAIGASDIPSAGIGAPHIRQRTFFGAVRLADTSDDRRHENGQRVAAPQRDGLVGDSTVERMADSIDAGSQGRIRGWQDTQRPDQHGHPGRDGAAIGLEHAAGNGREQRRPEPSGRGVARGRSNGGLADAEHAELGPISQHREDGRNGANIGREEAHCVAGTRGEVCERPNAPDGPWGTADWLFCRDGKWRPVESSLLGLADGLPAELVRSGAFVPASSPLAPKAQKGVGFDPGAKRVMRLRGYGNAINPWVAKVFIEAFVDTLRSGPDFVHCKSPLPLVNSTKCNIEGLL